VDVRFSSGGGAAGFHAHAWFNGFDHVVLLIEWHAGVAGSPEGRR